MFLDIGHRQYVNSNKITLIASYNSAPVRKDTQAAKERGTLIDATKGKRTLSVIYTHSYIILSSAMPETLSRRTERVREGGNSNNS